MGENRLCGGDRRHIIDQRVAGESGVINELELLHTRRVLLKLDKLSSPLFSCSVVDMVGELSTLSCLIPTGYPNSSSIGEFELGFPVGAITNFILSPEIWFLKMCARRQLS